MVSGYSVRVHLIVAPNFTAEKGFKRVYAENLSVLNFSALNKFYLSFAN